MSSSGQKQEEAVEESVGAIGHWLERFDVLVVGPGLGRDELVNATVTKVPLLEGFCFNIGLGRAMHPENLYEEARQNAQRARSLGNWDIVEVGCR